MGTHLKNLEATPGNNQEYTANFIIPNNFKVGEYEYYGLNIEVRQSDSNELVCGKYIFDSKNLETNSNYSPMLLSYDSEFNTIKVAEEYEKQKDILKSISLATIKNEYYLGDKLTFNVELTEEINSIAIYLKGPTLFYMFLLPECPVNNKTQCTVTGYIPRTMPGYSATYETGRTEWVITEGSYELSSITVYDKNGNYIGYTNNKEVSDNSDTQYNSYEKMIFNIKEPTNDALNDVNFVLDKFNLKKQTSAIGKTVPVDIVYSYEDSNKKVKSIYLVFRDSDKKRTFTSTIKSLYDNPYFVVASSADFTTYKLDGIGITFEAKDGTNNTIILNDTSNNGKYSEIFSQTIEITKQEDDSMVYLSAEELNAETYQQILNSREETIIIDADNYTIIPSELFGLIKKNTKKLIIRYNDHEWVFNGIDIENPKSINVLMNFYEINDSDISTNLKNVLASNTMILEFPNNGELPGDVLIRIKESTLTDKLTGDKYYIYYADTENDKLNKVALGVSETSDGYIEFYINHNSKYVISNKEITDKTVLGEDDPLLTKNTEINEVSSNKDIKHILLYSLIAVICILIVIIVISKISKKHNTTLNNENNDSKE